MNKILDVTCGSRTIWFDKENIHTLFCDIRSEMIKVNNRIINVRPDVICDFTNLPFNDNSYELVVMDPPQLDNLSENGWIAAAYGKLYPGWEDLYYEGLKECLRVSKVAVIFKWSEARIKLETLLSALRILPEFGTRTGKNNKTLWLLFLKKKL